LNANIVERSQKGRLFERAWAIVGLRDMKNHVYGDALEEIDHG
jgi:hypothetical protein